LATFHSRLADAPTPLGQRRDLTVMASGGSTPPRLLSHSTIVIGKVKGLPKAKTGKKWNRRKPLADKDLGLGGGPPVVLTPCGART